ncbi:MAG: type II toxin-antitoxin system VapC family toxin [Candidatus Thermoplasmatota archaeon]|nr:type II toxin-antitoxin system VapC family toxin [Candidatus Thermoplasmatota archaeon]
MIKRIYLDSCIFIAYFDSSDINHQNILRFLEKIKNRNDIELCSSSWTLTETIKVLLVDKKFHKKNVQEYAEKLLRESRLRDIKFKWLRSEDKPSCDLDEFFYLYQQKILEKRIGAADIMHAILMDIHNIDTIASFNDSDFKKLSNIKCIRPENIGRYRF